jgi:hypothetical protein
MSSPFTAAGYERFREFALANFTWLALVDDQGNEIIRIDVTSDSRMENTPGSASNPITYTLTVEGYDSDINNPVTIAETKLYEMETSTQPVGSDTMADATIETLGDTVTISHDQEIPLQ